MTTAAAQPTLDELLAGPIGRENYDQLVERVYETYANVDATANRVKQLEEEQEKLSAEERRDTAEKLGVICCARGEYEHAIAVLETVKSRKTASHFLGRALLQLGRAREAIAHLTNGHAGDDDLASDVLLVEAHCDLREPEAAEKILKRYRAHANEPAELRYARGRLAECTGEYAEAMAHYEAALQHDPSHAGSLFRLAMNCDLNGDDDRAMALYRKCTELRPAYVGAFMNLGILYEDHGKYREAIECYKRALAIDPRHKQAQLYLKDAESSLTMYVDVARARRAKRVDDFFRLPVGEEESLVPGIGRAGVEGEGDWTDATGEEDEDYDMEGEGFDTSEDLHEKLRTPVEALEFSTRCRKCMERLSVITVGQLIKHTEQDLLAVPNFGSTSLNEIKAKLAEMGLVLKKAK